MLFLLLCCLFIHLDEVKPCKKGSNLEKGFDYYFPYDVCVQYYQSYRDKPCLGDDTAEIQYWPSMGQEGNKLIAYEGDTLTLVCKADRQWSGCNMDRFRENPYSDEDRPGQTAQCWYDETFWNGARMYCRGGPSKCKKENYWHYVSFRERFGLHGVKNKRDYEENTCTFTGTAQQNMTGKWRCKTYAYSDFEAEPTCCQFTSAKFDMEIRKKPKGVITNKPPETGRGDCQDVEERHKLCRGSTHYTLIDGPNLDTGKVLELNVGERKNLTCHSNFKWGQCGLLYWEKEKRHGPNISLAYAYCPFENNECGKSGILTQTENPFDLKTIAEYDNDRCIFEGTVTPEWNGIYMCAMYSPSPAVISYEKCCRQVFSTFEISVKGNEKPKQPTPPPPDFYSIMGDIHDNSECEIKKAASRHIACIMDNFAVISGPHDRKTIENAAIFVATGHMFAITCKANKPWSVCKISNGGKEMRSFDCKKNGCGLDPDFKYRGVQYVSPSKPCIFEKYATKEDQGKWKCEFMAPNPYKTEANKCCRTAHFEFEVHAFDPTTTTTTSTTTTTTTSTTTTRARRRRTTTTTKPPERTTTTIRLPGRTTTTIRPPGRTTTTIGTLGRTTTTTRSPGKSTTTPKSKEKKKKKGKKKGKLTPPKSAGHHQSSRDPTLLSVLFLSNPLWYRGTFL